MKINFGILGCGHIGKRHALHIHEHPEANLVAVADVDHHKSAELSRQYGVEAVSPEELIQHDQVQIINICTPNGLHKEGAIAALEGKKHCLVEKPMALNREDCEAMIQAAMNAGRQLFIVKQNRYNPPVMALRQKIKEGLLGKIYSVQVNCYWNRNAQYYRGSNWKGTKDLDGGTLFTQFSHFVDIMYHLFGEITEISGCTANLGHGKLIEFEDTGYFNFKFKDGALGSFNYSTNAFKKNMEGSITVLAEKGSYKIGGQYLNLLEYQESESAFIGELPEGGKPNEYGHYQGSMSNHDKIIHNVVQTLNERETIMTNAMEGMKVVEIIQKMYAAADRS